MNVDHFKDNKTIYFYHCCIYNIIDHIYNLSRSPVFSLYKRRMSQRNEEWYCRCENSPNREKPSQRQLARTYKNVSGKTLSFPQIKQTPTKQNKTKRTQKCNTFTLAYCQRKLQLCHSFFRFRNPIHSISGRLFYFTTYRVFQCTNMYRHWTCASPMLSEPNVLDKSPVWSAKYSISAHRRTDDLMTTPVWLISV